MITLNGLRLRRFDLDQSCAFKLDTGQSNVRRPEQQCMTDNKGRIVMPFETALYITFILAVFAQFAAVLTYAEWATRQTTEHRPLSTESKQMTLRPAGNAAPIAKAA